MKSINFDRVQWQPKVFEVSEERFLNHMQKCKVQESNSELLKKRAAKRKELGLENAPKKQTKVEQKKEEK